VQPASGGVLTMSETQARWFAQVCKGSVGLPNRSEMVRDMEEEKVRFCFFYFMFLFYYLLFFSSSKGLMTFVIAL
jgi:hypothetical protein